MTENTTNAEKYAGEHGAVKSGRWTCRYNGTLLVAKSYRELIAVLASVMNMEAEG